MIAISIANRIGIALVLGAAMVIQASAQAPREAVASPAWQKEFDGFIAKFRAALKANDSATIASMTRLPLDYDRSIRDAA